MDPDYIDQDYEPRKPTSCACGPMPGICPGRENCPMCETTDDDEEDAE